MSRLWHGYGAYLRRRFGAPVRKVAIDAGFTCPNRDGTRGSGGCVYCDNASFNPNRQGPRLPVAEQVRIGMRAARGAEIFIAYFQAYTNTYAPVECLRALYEEALAVEGVVGLAIGTRPDCIDEATLDLLEELARRAYVQLEYGLQSACDETLARIDRGHTVADYVEAMDRSRGRGLHLTGHMIVGLPGESLDDFLHTQAVMVAAGIDSIKYHNLHVVKGSRLAEVHANEPVELMTLEAYADALATLLEQLPWRVVVQRVHGTAPKDRLVAPDWCLDGNCVRLAVERVLQERGTRQGSA